MNKILTVLRWLKQEAWEKINVAATWRELKTLGQKYGRRFFIAAFLWECIEDILFPILALRAGVPALVPVFLVLHFEPVVYPMFFWGFRTYDRIRGRTPWEPERTAMSSHMRSALKVLVYRVASLCTFWAVLAHLDINLWILTAYGMLMAFFGFVHERIWHDNNFGIRPDDTVEPKRNIVKALTYRGVSAMVMTMTLFGVLGSIPVGSILLYQSLMLMLYFGLETLWSRSLVGITPCHENSSN